LFIFEQEFFTHTGYWSALWNWPIPEDGTPEENKNRNRKFTLLMCWSGLRSMKILMGAFITLKHMLVSLHFTNWLENGFFQ
jgi:hypothetical protein